MGCVEESCSSDHLCSVNLSFFASIAGFDLAGNRFSDLRKLLKKKENAMREKFLDEAYVKTEGIYLVRMHVFGLSRCGGISAVASYFLQRCMTIYLKRCTINALAHMKSEHFTTIVRNITVSSLTLPAWRLFARRLRCRGVVGLRCCD